MTEEKETPRTLLDLNVEEATEEISGTADATTLNRWLRAEIRSTSPRKSVVKALTARLRALGERLNPTTSPLPPGNVVVLQENGVLEQKREPAADSMVIAGVATKLETEKDVIAALWPEDIQAEEEAKEPVEPQDLYDPRKDPELKKRREQLAKTAHQHLEAGDLNPANYTELELADKVRGVKDAKALKRMIDAELDGKNRDVVVRLLKQERDLRLGS